jgi:hypothetical protein
MASYVYRLLTIKENFRAELAGKNAGQIADSEAVGCTKTPPSGGFNVEGDEEVSSPLTGEDLKVGVKAPASCTWHLRLSRPCRLATTKEIAAFLNSRQAIV